MVYCKHMQICIIVILGFHEITILLRLHLVHLYNINNAHYVSTMHTHTFTDVVVAARINVI